VREIRQRKGVSQVELAKKPGVTQRGISYYENEANNTSKDVIDKIAAALDVSMRLLIEYNIEYNDEPLGDEPKAIRSLQQRLKVIPQLPPEGQNHLVETIDMLASKHGATITPEL
jgi:transcriptional regulator with XRE-family HTH domain